ncbi:MAG: CHAT domain-containing protein [Tolypothrix carrinoi HA7290-LM1]|jgi:CHAT domain-containing protein|nr:CHAT domain-containing protein [Tolypothrix carrinoi HA7290-LM1]
MNEQRQQDYQNLIALLKCSSNDETQILNNHSDLIDQDLVQTMQQEAAMLAEAGDSIAANRLQSVAAQLAEAIKDYLEFLIIVLTTISDSHSDQNVIYPLLEANLEKLDMHLAQTQVLSTFVKANLANVEPQMAQVMAANIFSFSRLIQEFPLGNRANNLEIAIAGYDIVQTVFTHDTFPVERAQIYTNLGIAYNNRIRGESSENLEVAIKYYHLALEVFTRSGFPGEWAQVQTNLAVVYHDRICGEKAENLEIAIQYCNEVLEVYKRSKFPEQWARTQHNLGGAYNHRIRGERAQNLEQAIACYCAALEVSTRSSFPEEWARIQNDLGVAYSDRICGERAQNLEQAIACYREALQVRTRSSFPEKWAMTQNNLGRAYSDRIRGESAQNLEQAIACHFAALEVYTPTSFPEDWAKTQMALGNAYRFRIRGEKAENLELAIACLHKALMKYTPSSFPQQWACVQHNLGTTYRFRIRGERAENLELAIACFREALQVRTRSSFPEEWALTQNNLGSAYRERIRRDRAENLEQAISCYRAALEVYKRDDFPKDWAVTQSNLGNSYLERIYGERAQNLEQAIESYRAALEVNTHDKFPQEWARIQNSLGAAYGNRICGERAQNLEQAINYYSSTLQIYTRNGFPEEWARSQYNLGNAYYHRVCGEKLENLKQAIDCYHRALEEHKPSRFPQDHAKTLFQLGLAYVDAENFQDAHNIFQGAINTVESLRGEIVSGSGIEEDKKKLAEEWNQLYQNMVAVCLNLRKPIEAIKYVERSKTRNLVELLANKNLYPKPDLYPNPDDYQTVCEQLHQLRQEIPAIQRQIEVVARSRELDQRNRTDMEQRFQQQLHDLQKQRANLFEEINQIDPSFKFTQQVEHIAFSDIQGLIDEDTAIIEWYIIENQILTFIVTRHGWHPTVLLSAPEDWKGLMGLEFFQYLNGNQKYHWYNNTQKQLSKLAEILHIDEILAQLPQGCNQLILIPHLWLHLLPLHALPLPKEIDKCLLDKFERGISYAPSCQLLKLNQKYQQSELKTLFAVQDPSSNLKYANLEVETIKSLFASTHVLVQQQATEAAVKTDKNLQSSHCLHFACHGEFNMRSPLESALLLAIDGGSEDGKLTLAEIFGLNLTHNRLVTLSACETGLTDSSSTSDEYISLPSGFLYAGSSNVVSSLWTVNDLSTAILMIKFYENLYQGLSVAVALNQAQLWLRDATKDQLKNWIEQHQLSLKLRKAIPVLDKQLLPVDSDQPFHDPFYWAAFCAIGN